MSRIRVESYVRSGEDFLPVQKVGRYAGDCMYMPGAISFVVDEVELMGVDLWDDVNWLWPLVIQALDDCRRTGSGKRGFPDQPISFTAEMAWQGNVLLTVSDGDSINRTAVARADEVFEAVARAGVDFFGHSQTLCPGSDVGREERAVLDLWSA